MSAFLGFDHIDARVVSVAAVEPFYDRLMPRLGMPRKKHSVVENVDEWRAPQAGENHNVVEYYEEPQAGRATFFIGFIEDAAMQPVHTRIAFRVKSPDDLKAWRPFLEEIGAKNIEFSASMDEYPALFFEDPAGTKLELVARQFI